MKCFMEIFVGCFCVPVICRFAEIAWKLKEPNRNGPGTPGELARGIPAAFSCSIRFTALYLGWFFPLKRLCVPDLKQFGRRFRELRTGRGVTQDEVLKRSSAYGDVRGLRKLENGEVRPGRKAIIDLLFTALEERDPATFDELLPLAGYRSLSEIERAQLGLTVSPPEPEPLRHAHSTLRFTWRLTVPVAIVVSIAIGWRVSGFDWVCALMFSSLFGVSVLLEAAHEFRGRETIEAASSASAIVLPMSLGALRLDSRGITAHQSETLLYALLLIVAGAATQWLLVRPALPSYTIVQSRFQSQTAQAAHLKNTGYFLLLAFLFWLPSHHCGEALRLHSEPGFCPPPLALWIVFALLVAAAVPMGAHLLDNLQPAPNQNVYFILFWLRAFLFFLLSAMILLWYSIAGS
jgi:transcriptional regulator with XRE-family HTH domain